MISKNHVLLALGVVGLTLFSVRGKSRKMAGGGTGGQDRKDAPSWDGRNRKLPSTIVYPSTDAPSP